jgi:hypothetical protein
LKRNFYTVKETAELLNSTSAEVKRAAEAAGIERIEGVYLIGYWQLAEIKKALKARAAK